jgi:transcriptional regulator with XRE-family HTH domain
VNKAQISLQAAVRRLLKKGYTQDEIAAYIGVAQITVSRWARGILPVKPKKIVMEGLRRMAEQKKELA